MVSSSSSSSKNAVNTSEDPNDGLRTIVRKSLFRDVFGNVNAKWKRWAVLIVDDPSLRMVSSVLGMYDLMENRVTLVESLVKKRAPFPNMAAVYLVSPTEESVDAVVKDWKDASVDPKQQPGGGGTQNYANAVFLYFTSVVPDALLAKIKACKPLTLRLRAFSEINVEFLSKEERAFDLDMRPSTTLRHLYLQAGVTGIHDIITDKLVTACATLNEYPHVRYREDSPLSQTLANNFHAKMNAYVSRSPGWWYRGDGSEKGKGERGTLLLVDRTIDPLSPLMHEFTYQAMVQDLLKVRDDKITYRTTASATTTTAAPTTSSDQNGGDDDDVVTKDVLLNDNDSLWIELRGRHIADVIKDLSAKIRDVVNSNSGAVYTKDSGKDLSLTQMSSALRDLPEYREIMSKLSQHMHLAHESMDILGRQSLVDLSDLEQTLATGQEEDGTRPRLADLLVRVKERLSGENNTLSKVRLLAILMISQRKHLKEEDMEALYEESDLKEDHVQILKNLKHLEVFLGDTTKEAGVSRTEKLANMVRGTRLTTNANNNAQTDSEYASSRYVCKLKSVLDDMCLDRLSEIEFPSVLPLPTNRTAAAASVRSRTRSRWAGKTRNSAAARQKVNAFSGPRQMVFMAGGLCYSELRSAHEIMARGDREIVMGATHFMNPLEYVQAVKNCKV